MRAQGFEHRTADSSGSWTYAETVARGHYHRNQGGLFGKYDNVRTYWEDELTRFVLRPFVREKIAACAAANRGLRILDLGCGSGEGYELLTKIRQNDLSLEELQRYVVTPEQIGLYLGVDLNSSMVQQGRENYGEAKNVRFAQADLREKLGEAERERPFDIYFSSYGSLSHLSSRALNTCLSAVARHAEPGALVVLDLMGRFSPEWPDYWQAREESEKVRPYSMSYLFPEQERRSTDIAQFPLRFWTGQEVRTLCAEVSEQTGVVVEPVEMFDRSLFVGRHVDTGEYGTCLPPLRSLVNGLYEQNVRTNFERFVVTYRPVAGAHVQNAFFSRLSACWNTAVEFARVRLSGARVDLVEMPGWREFPAPLQLSLMTIDRVIDSVAWIDYSDVRANIIEPQIAYVLRGMQYHMQEGLGCGHGLVALLRIAGAASEAEARQRPAHR